MSEIFSFQKINEFPAETKQIQYWISILKEIKLTFNMILKQTKKYQRYSTVLNLKIMSIKNSYFNHTLRYVSEPSNTYNLVAYLLSAIENFSCLINSSRADILPNLQNTIPNLVKNIDELISNIITTSNTIMTEVSDLKEKTIQLNENYKKSKINLDQLQLKKKKIENDPSTVYNDKVKEKAENEVIQTVQEIESKLPEIKEYSKRLESKKEIFNSHMKDTFEVVVMNVFKSFLHLNQLICMLGQYIQDVNSDLYSVFNDKIIKEIKNIDITINEYSERNYAKSKNIIYDPIHFMGDNQNEEVDSNLDKGEINRVNINSLCNSYLLYVDTFYDCTHIRKKIISSVIFFINEYLKAENFYLDKIKKLNKYINNFLKDVKEGVSSCNGNKISFDYTSSLYNNIEKSTFTLTNFLTTHFLQTCSDFRKNAEKDYSTFLNKWDKFSKKIKSMQDDYEKIQNKKLNSKNNKDTSSVNDKSSEIENKLRKYLLKDCHEFLTLNVNRIRNNDLKRGKDLCTDIEEIINILYKTICFNNENSKDLIDHVTDIDIFEDIKEIFFKYFQKFEISNYESYMNGIKIKVLNKINFKKEVLFDSKLNKNLKSDQNILDNDETEIKDLTSNNLSIEKVCESNFLSSDNNLDLIDIRDKNDVDNDKETNINLNEEKASEKADEKVNESVKEKANEKSNENDKSNDNSKGNNKSEDKISISESDSDEDIEFINKNNFNIIKNEELNPYKNFKENELKKIMEKINVNEKKDDSEIKKVDDNIILDQPNERYIDKFRCLFKVNPVHNRAGFLYLTSYKVIFYSKKTKISIPLKDINCVQKIDIDKRNGGIEIMTKKMKKSFKFYFFEDRSKFMDNMNEQIEATKKEEDNSNDNIEENQVEDKNSKFSKQLYQRNKEIQEMLTKMKFNERLKEITEKRKKMFEEEYANEKIIFQNSENMHLKAVINEYISNTPSCFIYDLLFNTEKEIEDMGQHKAFFESYSLNRGDTEVTYGEINNKLPNIPMFYGNIEYCMNLFSELNENELENFLNEIENWPKTSDFELKFIHPLGKSVMGIDKVGIRNKYYIHFISPSLFIVDYVTYSSKIPFADTFVTDTQMHFNTDFKFNKKNGIFNFKTTLSLYFNVTMVKSCLFESSVKSEGYNTNDPELKINLFEAVKGTLDNNGTDFLEMFHKLANEKLRKSLYKYSGDVEVDENVKEEDLEEEKKEGKDEKQNTPNKEVKSDNNGQNTNKSESNKYLKILCCIIVLFFSYQIVGNKTNTILQKLFNFLILLVVGFLFYKIIYSKK